MKIPLTTTIVKNLKLELKPAGYANGKITYQPNPEGKDYILFCSHQDSPPGFGVKVAGKKTWVIQRRVSATKVIKATVGNCADWSLDAAREKAADMAREMKVTGLNPNETARKIAAGEITLGGAMLGYKTHLQNRQKKKARPNTIKNFERAERRFQQANWSSRRIRDISTGDVLALFAERMESAPTCNEQNFTWVSLAIRHAIDQEILDAASANRAPTLTANPFKILKLKGMYRPESEVEAARALNRSRNPLGPTTTLGIFLEAAWARRSINRNDTGVDFLITELVVGARRGELGTVEWGDLLEEKEREDGSTSHVYLEPEGKYGPYMFFNSDSTKNRRPHRIPLSPLLVNLFRKRRDEGAQRTLKEGFGRKGRRWVFPARNKLSSTGYYQDGSYLLDAIASEVGIDVLNPHDLRRSMGAVMVALSVPEVIQSRLFNHTWATQRDDPAAAVTARYSQPEWALLREWAEKIQDYIFSTAPNVYNSLRPADQQPLPAKDPHVPTPPKTRSGRPRKINIEESAVVEEGTAIGSSRMDASVLVGIESSVS